MCGLIGATGKIESRYLIALGCLSEKRGSDSAGVAWQVGERLRVAKIAQNPLVAFPVTLAPAIRHAAKYGGALIGHTRAATTGAVTNKNAHPFLKKESRIAWAHNGVITNYHQFGSYDVDSESLIGGIEKKDFKEYYGPVALLWIEDGKIHAFRKGNPLYRGIKRGGVYLASEQSMLADIGCKRIKELSEGHLYVWNGDKLESSAAIPYNKSYTTRYSNYEYAGCGGRSWRDGMDWPDEVWDETTRTWRARSEVTGAEVRSNVHGCAGGRTTYRAPGFRFSRRESLPSPAKDDAQVIGDAPNVPVIAPSGADSPPESSPDAVQPEIFNLVPVRDGGGLTRAKFEPDTLAELDAEAEDALADEMKEMDKICVECLANPKAFGRDYCELCFAKYLSNMGLCD